MRLAPWAVVLIFIAPSALAAETEEAIYVVAGEGLGGGNTLTRNGSTHFPTRDQGQILAELEDLSGRTVFVKICHEWTYDDGSHPRVTCRGGCSPVVFDPLAHPPWPWNTTYRVIVDLRDGPAECEARAQAGTMRVTLR